MIITGEEILSWATEKRDAALAEITELTRLLRPGDTVPLSIDRLAAINKAGRAVFYVEDNHIVGCGNIVVYPSLATDMPTLENVAVNPAFRRRGIARSLVEDLIKWAKDRRLWRVALLTEPDNEGARALYRSLGFQEVELIRGRLRL